MFVTPKLGLHARGLSESHGSFITGRPNRIACHERAKRVEWRV
jgi:hypothetical protein